MAGGSILILFTLGSIVLLLFLILYVRLHAFLALMLPVWRSVLPAAWNRPRC